MLSSISNKHKYSIASARRVLRGGHIACQKTLVLLRMLEEHIRCHDNIWQEMKDVMVMEMDPVTGAQPLMQQVFLFD